MDFIEEKKRKAADALNELNELSKKNKLVSNSNIQELQKIPKEQQQQSILETELSSTPIQTPSPNIKQETISEMDNELRKRRNRIQEEGNNNLNNEKPKPLDLPQLQDILKEFTDNQPNKDGKIITSQALRPGEEDIIQKTCNESDTIDSDSDSLSVGEQGDIDEIIDTGFWDFVVNNNSVDENTKLNILINIIYNYEDVYNNNFNTDLEPQLYKYIHDFYRQIEGKIKSPLKTIVEKLKESMKTKHEMREKIINTYLSGQEEQSVEEKVLHVILKIKFQ